MNISKVNHLVDAGFKVALIGNVSHIETVKGGVCDFELMVNNTSPISHVSPPIFRFSSFPLPPRKFLFLFSKLFMHTYFVQVFSVFVDDNVWPTEAPPHTGRLRPRQTASFHILISVPANTRRTLDRVTVSVRSDTDGFTRQALDLECSIPVAKVKIAAKKLPQRNTTTAGGNATKSADGAVNGTRAASSNETAFNVDENLSSAVLGSKEEEKQGSPSSVELVDSSSVSSSSSASAQQPAATVAKLTDIEEEPDLDNTVEFENADGDNGVVPDDIGDV